MLAWGPAPRSSVCRYFPIFEPSISMIKTLTNPSDKMQPAYRDVVVKKVQSDVRVLKGG